MRTLVLWYEWQARCSFATLADASEDWEEGAEGTDADMYALGGGFWSIVCHFCPIDE